MWKVYRIETDEILKAGFVTEEEAKEWMDRHNLDEDDETITMDEMDSDEEEQWLEAHEEETYLPIEKDGEEEDEDTNIEGLNFRSGSVDMEDDDYLDNGEHFDDEDLDEDEGEDEESEEEDDD